MSVNVKAQMTQNFVKEWVESGNPVRLQEKVHRYIGHSSDTTTAANSNKQR